LSYLANTQTDRQTDRQTKSGKNITSLAEVITFCSLVVVHQSNIYMFQCIVTLESQIVMQK